MKRALSLLLAVCMVISMVPSMFAEEPAAEPEEEVVVISEPEVVEEVTAEPETAPAEEPTEAEPEAAETEAAAEETEAAEEAAEEATEATEEVTEEATEAAEEVTEETTEAAEEVTEETEVPEEAEEEPEAEEKGYDWVDLKNIEILQIANNKVTISWETGTDGDKPASYVIAEMVNDKLVKRGVTTGNSITISNVAYGDHEYRIYFSGYAKGTLDNMDDNWCEKVYIYTYKQTWRSAPSIKLTQDVNFEGRVKVTVSANDYLCYYLFEFTYPDGSVYYDMFDVINWEWVMDTDPVFDQFVPKGKGSNIQISDKAVEKGGNTHWFIFPLVERSPEYSCRVNVRVTRIGDVNNEGTMALGTPSAKKSITLKPQWKKAPRFYYAGYEHPYTEATEQPWAHLEWDYYGEPTSFDIYDGNTFVTNVLAPGYDSYWDCNWAYVYVPLLTPGKHTFKVVPVFDLEDSGGRLLGSAAKKSVTAKTKWMTTKPTVTLSQPEENTVQLDWKYIGGACGYEIWEIVKDGKQTKEVYQGYTPDNTFRVEDVSLGSHSYVVRPYGWQSIPQDVYHSEIDDYWKIYGKDSAKKTIKVKELWKTAPKNVEVDVVDPSTNYVRIRWDAPGAPGDYIVKIMQGKTEVAREAVPASATSSRRLDYNLPGYGTYTISVCAAKDGVSSPWSAAKKLVFGPQTEGVGTYRALIIGNTYQSNWNVSSLPGCENDANAMESLLNTMHATPYDVKKMIDVDGRDILSAISTAFQGAQSNDVSLFYYSGHGYNKTGYLVGNDGDGVSFKQLRAALDRIPGKKIVLLDSCFSGQAIGKGEDATDEDLQAYADAAMAAFYEPAPKSGELAAKNYYVMTACSKTQTSAEYGIDGFSFGGFTYCFGLACGWDEIENQETGLAADSNHDNYISLAEAFARTDANVRLWGMEQITRVNPANSPFILFGRAVG